MHFLLWLQWCIFVLIVVLYEAGHGKEHVMEMVRVKSANSPLSAMAMVKAPPQGKVYTYLIVLCTIIDMYLIVLCT